MSERAYALHCGLSRPAVAKARLTGRLALHPDGSIDAEASDRRRAETTDPSKQRARQPMRAAPEAAVDAVRETLAEAGLAAPADGMTYLQARTATETLRVAEQRLKLQRLQDSLIDRKKATAHVLALARQTRDSWLGWPARVAPGMAAELAVDAHRLQTVLENHVRQHIAEMGEIRIDFS